MASKSTHPYIPSSGILVQAFTQFRKMMPSTVDATRLKQLGIAPGNEAAIIGAIRFLGFIDESSNTTKEGKEVFLKHEDTHFSKALEAHVQKAYSALFEARGNESWSLERDHLISFFRVTDETSALTAKRQAVAFETLAALSGHRDVATPRPQGNAQKSDSKPAERTARAKKSSAGKITNPTIVTESPASVSGGMALTVRIEVNLPAQADQETYNRIFKSIRENLLNG